MPHSRAHRRPSRRLAGVAVAAALAVAAAACGEDADPGESGTAPTTAGAEAPSTTAGETTTTEPEATGDTIPAPEGLPDFYAVPDPLPEGEPGTVIKTEAVEVDGLHGSLLRVMYLSESLAGDPIAVTGLIAVPETAAPEGGYEVVSWAHGTTGIADECAPSLDTDGYVDFANLLLDAGYLVTATDYEGLGTPGRHPYVVGESEARGTIDIVRAAQNLPDLAASTRYAVWGHSQGGHAAMFSLHIADAWAPELDLVGVVAGAPPSQLNLIYAALQQSPFKYYLLMAAAGFNAAYGDEGAPLDAVLSPEGLEALDAVDQGCTGDLADLTADVDTQALVAADPSTVPEWAEILTENDPGTFAEPAAQPLLIIHGGSDEQIPVASSELLFGQLCPTGQVLERWVYPGQSHAGVIGPSLPDMLTWIGDRFAGSPAPDIALPTTADTEVTRCPG